MRKYLIALDLDGTILYDYNTISEELCLFMKKIQEKGHKILVVTGRPLRSSLFVYRCFDLDTPIINYNGGSISHPNDPSFQKINYTIPKAAVIDVFNKNLPYITNAFCEINDEIYLYQKDKDIDPWLHKEGATSIKLGHFKDTLKQDPNGFIVFAKAGMSQKITTYVKEHYHKILSSRFWSNHNLEPVIEIFTPLTNKGKALKYVADILGFPKENIIAIGDGENDIELIEYASLGVVVKDAHPLLKETADIILDYTSKENAVKKFLSEYLKID